ncbi:MAG TPA: ClpX C4-type zinc finger protein [Actinophytocola sp.]|nr:ClpX C4-type zinc finger protein [Actinophytocola sp.]HET9142426.1 ClpX C4-type zinc finger protein [Actinophytocola sp.]
MYICDRCVARAQHTDPAPAAGLLECSFCGKAPGTALFAGPDVRICGECLQLCEEILAAVR